MIVLKILGIIAVIIALIMLIPIGADVGYEDGKLRLSAKIAGMLLQLYPKAPRDESKVRKKSVKPKKQKSEAQQNEESKPKKKLDLNFTKEEILELIKKVLGGFGVFGKKLRVERFLLHYVAAAGDNPYNTAVTFGYVNAALNVLAPICSNRFTVENLDVSTSCDFTADKTKIDFGIALTIRIGAIFRMIFAITFGALGILIKNKLRLRREKKALGKLNTIETVNPEIEKEDTCGEQDERKIENGK